MKANLVKAIQNDIDAGYDIFDINDTVFLALGNTLTENQYLICDGKIIGLIINGIFQPYDSKTPWKKLCEEKRRSIKDYRYNGFEPFGMDGETMMLSAVDDQTTGNILKYLIESKECKILRKAYRIQEPEGDKFVQPVYELWDAEEEFICNLRCTGKE